MSFDRLVELPGSLSEQMTALWSRQAAEWPRLAQGVANLRAARIRTFAARGATLKIQSNPARIVSTGAKIDAASIAARPCFLCPANLPVEQLAIAYVDKWLILCNPAPILEPHFVISSTLHEPQRTHTAAGVVLDLARELSGQYTVFYNGPASGASAPDHLHVQAVKTGVLPFETEMMTELARSTGWIEWLQGEPVRTGLTRKGRRPAVVMQSGTRDELLAAIEKIVNLLAEVRPAEPEPLLNLFALHSADGWLVYVFPRSAHRPASYGQGPGQFIVSPGCVDLGGIIIAPRPEDFDRLTADVAAGLLDEVLLPPEPYAQLRAKIELAFRASGG